MRDWIFDLIEASGYFGVGLLMFITQVFPLLPTELVMPVAGYMAGGGGNLNIWGVVLAGTIGSIVGTFPWYFISRKLGRESMQKWLEDHGVWVAFTAEDLEKADRWFERHGHSTIFFARLIPGMREFISIPAGFSVVSFVSFLFYSILGLALWTGFLGGAGFLLGRQWPDIHNYIVVATWIILGAAVILYFYRVIKLYRARRNEKKRD
jgi:membrane protein DedA with SNARE-associated domain